MLKHHSDTSPAELTRTVLGRPGTVTEDEASEAYAGEYKDPEVVDRWLEWESE